MTFFPMTVMKHTLTLAINPSELHTVTDEYLAALWYVAQFQPDADVFNQKAAGDLVEKIGREIIQRWMRGVPVPVWNVQGNQYYWNQLRRFAKCDGDNWIAKPDAAAPTIKHTEVQQ